MMICFFFAVVVTVSIVNSIQDQQTMRIVEQQNEVIKLLLNNQGKMTTILEKYNIILQESLPAK